MHPFCSPLRTGPRNLWGQPGLPKQTNEQIKHTARFPPGARHHMPHAVIRATRSSVPVCHGPVGERPEHRAPHAPAALLTGRDASL